MDLEKIEDKEMDLQEAKKAYLKKNGWKYSSNYPGAFWLWENTTKGFKGCSTQTALSIQGSIDRYLEYTQG